MGEPHRLIVELRELRKRAGMKAAVHAAYADVAASALSHYETGRRHPTLPVLERLCAVLGCRLAIEVDKGGARARGTGSAAPDDTRARREE